MIKFVSQLSLRTVLKLDACTCAVMAGLLLLASAPVAGITQINASILFWAGVVLIPVAGFMAAAANANRVPSWTIFLIVVGNLLWVIASLALPLSGLISPNGLGWAFLLVQAAAVTLFAELEWNASRHQPALA